MSTAGRASCTPNIDGRPDTTPNTSQDCPNESGQSFFISVIFYAASGLADRKIMSVMSHIVIRTCFYQPKRLYLQV